LVPDKHRLFHSERPLHQAALQTEEAEALQLLARAEAGEGAVVVAEQ
jgi:hypothetical protein